MAHPGQHLVRTSASTIAGALRGGGSSSRGPPTAPPVARTPLGDHRARRAHRGAALLGPRAGLDTVLYAVFSCALAGTGALILSRHPRHLIGWLLIGVGLENAVAGELAQGWALHAQAGGLPFGPAADTLAAASWLPQAPAFVLIILLFPTDRMPGPMVAGVLAERARGGDRGSRLGAQPRQWRGVRRRYEPVRRARPRDRSPLRRRVRPRRRWPWRAPS